MTSLADCRKLVGRVGRPYYSQARTLIQICRDITSGVRDKENTDGFSTILEDAHDSLSDVVNGALEQPSKDAFEGVFKDILEFCLNNMEPVFHDNIVKKISGARDKDKTSTGRLQSLIQRVSSRVKIPSSSKIVELHLLQNLRRDNLSKNGVHAIPMEIDAHTGLEGLLFMLVLEKHVQLKDNPHFYYWLPVLTERNVKWDNYKPIQRLDYDQIHSNKVTTLSILIDDGDQAFVECVRFSRRFRALWQYHQTFVFKEITGVFQELKTICDDHARCCSPSENCRRIWHKKLSASFSETMKGRNTPIDISLTCPGSISSASDAETGSIDSLGTGTTAVESELQNDTSSREQVGDDSDNSSPSSFNTEHQDSGSASSSSVTAENTEYHGSDNTPPSSAENINHCDSSPNRAGPSPSTPTDHPSPAKTSNPDMSNSLEPPARTIGATVDSINKSKGTPRKQQPPSAGSGHSEKQGKGRSGGRTQQCHVTPKIPPLRDRSTPPPLSNASSYSHSTSRNKASVTGKTTPPSPKPRGLEGAHLTSDDHSSPRTNLSNVDPGQRKTPPSDATSSITPPFNTPSPISVPSVGRTLLGGDLDHDTTGNKEDVSHNNTSRAPSLPDVSHPTPELTVRDPVQQGDLGRASAEKGPQPVSRPASRTAGSYSRMPPGSIRTDPSRATSVDTSQSHGEIATPSPMERARQAGPAPKKKGWLAAVKEYFWR